MQNKDSMLKKRKDFYDAISTRNLSINEAVKLMRKLVGKTQPEFAKLTGIALGALRDIEQGKGNPTQETLNKIGAPFGLTLGYHVKKHESK